MLGRLIFMMFCLMERTIPWREVLTAPFAFAVYHVGYALLVLSSRAPLGRLDGFAIAFRIWILFEHR